MTPTRWHVVSWSVVDPHDPKFRRRGHALAKKPFLSYARERFQHAIYPLLGLTVPGPDMETDREHVGVYADPSTRVIVVSSSVLVLLPMAVAAVYWAIK